MIHGMQCRHDTRQLPWILRLDWPHASEMCDRQASRQPIDYLGVEHDSDVLPAAGGQRLPQAAQGGGVSLVVAVAEVQTRHVHPGIDQLPEGLHAPAGRTESADDLGFPPRLIAVRENLFLAMFGEGTLSFTGAGGCGVEDSDSSDFPGQWAVETARSSTLPHIF